MTGSQMQMYLENQNELVKKFNGKIIALQNGQVIGSYPTKLAAWQDMKRRNIPDGDYIIIKCTPGEEAYTTYWASYISPQEEICDF